MPQKKNNNNELAACTDSCGSGIDQPNIGHYICLSHPPSECSITTTSCHSGICNSDYCKSVKILDDYDDNPMKAAETRVSNVPLGKCDKCGVQQLNVHTGNQTLKDSKGLAGACSTCSRSTTCSSDRLKTKDSQSQRPFNIPPTTPVKPHSCGIERPPEQTPRDNRNEKKSSIRSLPECCQEKNTPKEQLGCDNSCHEQPSRDSRDGRKSSLRSLPECCQEKNQPIKQLGGNKSSQNVQRQSGGTFPSSTAIPPSTPAPQRCTMSGCPVPCINEEKNLNDTDVPAHESSKVYTMPMHPVGAPRRQGSNIAANAHQIIKSSLLRRNSTQKHDVKKRSKDSKTSIRSNASSKCKCPPKPQEGCECHYPPAFQHYFQCAGTITGVCCCSENK